MEIEAEMAINDGELIGFKNHEFVLPVQKCDPIGGKREEAEGKMSNDKVQMSNDKESQEKVEVKAEKT